ncbi:hypothetical protein FisN_10Hh182 [Fistulifera solaris]|uniref:NAD(P)-binding domain-containing protein n=1 Tax=Fistulifera solaris TaxID=1519565 RepID=A0A1Z5JXW9_FISSO|nr:hypothetical protein FisN_10Hh182 [Fistulifera solaris]|eukprot:GAX18611.1 hypothetical protein FisN_10Hh182 [Fistulifera solaris]
MPSTSRRFVSCIPYMLLWAVWESEAFLMPARPTNSVRIEPFTPASASRTRIILQSNTNKNKSDSDDVSGNNEEPSKRKKAKKNDPKDAEAKKQDLLKAVGERMRSKQQQDEEQERPNLLDKLNPFKAGQNLRKQIDTALTSIKTSDELKSSIYYLDDRFTNFQDGTSSLGRLVEDDYIPEILVVGATGEIGRLVVKRLLQEGRSRVRVLVRDLYTQTLNMLGTGVTYCQGDLNNIESLEYAVTDVDKIIFCTNPPRADEDEFQEKFREFMEENLDDDQMMTDSGAPRLAEKGTASDREWEQMESVLEVRAQLAKQVDLIGLNNIVQAFLNVRHSDYGTSQAAKRSLFKFQGRPEDFNLFSLDEEDVENASEGAASGDLGYDPDDFSDIYDDFEDDDDDYVEKLYESEIEKRKDASVKMQTQWIRNQFGHGVFVGRVPKPSEGRSGGEAAITSSRLRSRQDPENGIDLGAGFGGFIVRVCSDGGTYEAFVRTKEYYDNGIEYVCQFSTASKSQTSKNKSRNKFVTVRLPFENFRPVQQTEKVTKDINAVPVFQGSDVRNIGFRYRSSSNPLKTKLERGEWSSFYLALSYIKLYKSQPEPEFVYLSDAQIPPVVQNSMIRHEARQLALAGSNDDVNTVKLLDDSTFQTLAKDGAGRLNSPEETYYKYRGEEIVRNSGLNYAIVRVSGFNEIPSAEETTIDLQPSNEYVTSMSRAEIAQVCVSAVMEPNALNKCFYVTKKVGTVQVTDANMKEKFRALPTDKTR